MPTLVSSLQPLMLLFFFLLSSVSSHRTEDECLPPPCLTWRNLSVGWFVFWFCFRVVVFFVISFVCLLLV